MAERRSRRWLWWTGAGLLVALAGLGVAGEIMARRVGPLIRARVVETLSARFHARVRLNALDVSLVKGLEVAGDGLSVDAPDDRGGTGAPLVTVRHFTFHVGLRALFEKPMRVTVVRVTGMEVHIPPRPMQLDGTLGAEAGEKRAIEVERVLCEDSALTIDTADMARQPKRFVLQRVELTNSGPGAGWVYDADVVNAIPKGEIHATGQFGPWVAAQPAVTALRGHYTFDHADLATIHGIGGVLSSTGDFTGQLNRIDVTGEVQVPGFWLASARQPMPLDARFHAVVDGTSGDTQLEKVDARLRGSRFTCRGSVVNVRGKGHVTELEVNVPDGYVQDFLALAVKTRPVVMTGRITTRARLHIPYGKESVMEKMQVRAQFSLRQLHLTNAKWQNTADSLSLRAQGRPAEAVAGAPDQPAEMNGDVTLAGAKLDFTDLKYVLPGASVELAGVYSLNGEQFHFQGTARTQAKPSEMVRSWWKQLLLKPVDHFLTKGDAGLALPVTLNGTRSDPKFGVDLGRLENSLRPTPAR